MYMRVATRKTSLTHVDPAFQPDSQVSASSFRQVHVRLNRESFKSAPHVDTEAPRAGVQHKAPIDVTSASAQILNVGMPALDLECFPVAIGNCHGGGERLSCFIVNDPDFEATHARALIGK